MAHRQAAVLADCSNLNSPSRHPDLLFMEKQNPAHGLSLSFPPPELGVQLHPLHHSFILTISSHAALLCGFWIFSLLLLPLPKSSIHFQVSLSVSFPGPWGGCGGGSPDPSQYGRDLPVTISSRFLCFFMILCALVIYFFSFSSCLIDCKLPWAGMVSTAFICYSFGAWPPACTWRGRGWTVAVCG